MVWDVILDAQQTGEGFLLTFVKQQTSEGPPKETQDCHQAHHRKPRDAPCKVLEERNNQESASTDRKAGYNLINIIKTLLAASSVGVFYRF